MSKALNSIIPANMQDIDPGVRERIEKQLKDAGLGPTPTERNPQAKMMHDYVGTPVKSKQEIADDVEIKSQKEVNLRMTAVLARATNACHNTTHRAAFVDAIEAALDATSKALGIAVPRSVAEIQAQVRAEVEAHDAKADDDPEGSPAPASPPAK